MQKTGFDLCDPEGLAFEASPSLFVLCDREPITWTTRGLAYFVPRFRSAGILIATIRTCAELDAALNEWLDIEFRLLLEKIERRATSRAMHLEHRALWAILNGESDEARRLEAIIRTRDRTNLRLVPRT